MSEENWIKCTKCGMSIPPVFSSHTGDDESLEQIDDGIKLVFEDGYGMFTDMMMRPPIAAFLCHDCTVELLEFFPESFREQFKNGHPYSHKENGKCCKYSWNFEDEEKE